MELTVWTFLILFTIALAVSFLAAMVGIGGGVLFVPLLVSFFGLDVPEARTYCARASASLFCKTFLYTIPISITTKGEQSGEICGQVFHKSGRKKSSMLLLGKRHPHFVNSRMGW